MMEYKKGVILTPDELYPDSPYMGNAPMGVMEIEHPDLTLTLNAKSVIINDGQFLAFWQELHGRLSAIGITYRNGILHVTILPHFGPQQSQDDQFIEQAVKELWYKLREAGHVCCKDCGRALPTFPGFMGWTAEWFTSMFLTEVRKYPCPECESHVKFSLDDIDESRLLLALQKLPNR